MSFPIATYVMITPRLKGRKEEPEVRSVQRERKSGVHPVQRKKERKRQLLYVSIYIYIYLTARTNQPYLDPWARWP